MWWWPRSKTKDGLQKAEARLEEAKHLAAQSRNLRAGLRRELDHNGFTELFQQAMRGRS